VSPERKLEFSEWNLYFTFLASQLWSNLIKHFMTGTLKATLLQRGRTLWRHFHSTSLDTKGLVSFFVHASHMHII